MKKIAILGCENSHAKNFLSFIKEDGKYKDVEVVGVYSYDEAAMLKLKESFGVPMLSSYDEAVGRVDGLIITARDGKYHYEYAKPYIKEGIPMFIDKPVTVDKGEAVEFMKELKANGIKVTGGSSLRQAAFIITLKEEAEKNVGGKTVGGIVRAPLEINSIHSGFFFYAQHLVEMVTEVYGRYPISVKAVVTDHQKTVVFKYEDYDVVGIFYDKIYKYFAARFTEEGTHGDVVELGDAFVREFDVFNSLLDGKEQEMSYEDFIAPVFIMNAINESLASGEEVKVERCEI
jgi:predicted dehydrogenase